MMEEAKTMRRMGAGDGIDERLFWEARDRRRNRDGRLTNVDLQLAVVEASPRGWWVQHGQVNDADPDMQAVREAFSAWIRTPGDTVPIDTPGEDASVTHVLRQRIADAVRALGLPGQGSSFMVEFAYPGAPGYDHQALHVLGFAGRVEVTLVKLDSHDVCREWLTMHLDY